MKIKLFKKSHDGGPNSGVTGYWLIEEDLFLNQKESTSK